MKKAKKITKAQVAAAHAEILTLLTNAEIKTMRERKLDRPSTHVDTVVLDLLDSVLVSRGSPPLTKAKS